MRYCKSIIFFIILLFVCISLYTFFKPSNSNFSTYTTCIVTKVDDLAILVKDLDSNQVLQVTKSEVPIIDKDDNKLSWNDITTSSKIEIYYSGSILEVYPSRFEKIYKIVILN